MEKQNNTQELNTETLNEVAGGARVFHHRTAVPHNKKTVTITDPNDPIIKKIPRWKPFEKGSFDLVHYTKEEVKFLEKRGYTPHGYHGDGECFVANPDEIWCLVTNGFKVDITK